MKDEIKEILDELKETADYPKLNYSSYDKSYNETIDNVAMIKSFACKQLLDYITNLQEENKRLKELCDKYEEEHNTAFKLWTMKMEEIPTYEEKKELQNRIDKSIEYINRYEGKATIKDIYESELKSILQGSDE